MFLRDKSPGQLVLLMREIEQELDAPTQQVRDIAGNVASEESCRQFLADFVSFVREALANYCSDDGFHVEPGRHPYNHCKVKNGDELIQGWPSSLAL